MPKSVRGHPLKQPSLFSVAPDEFDYQAIMEAFAQYVAEERPKLERPTDVADLMRPILADKEQEEFWSLLMDTKNRLRHSQLVTVGLLDRSQIHAREVFRPAIEHLSSRVILVHNHPSGDPTPSSQDIDCTRGLVEAGKIIGIQVMDHVIIGKQTPSRSRDYVSFREESLLSPAGP